MQFYRYWQVRKIYRTSLTPSEQMLRFWSCTFKFLFSLTLSPLLPVSTVALPELGCACLSLPALLVLAAAGCTLLCRASEGGICSAVLSKRWCWELGFPSPSYLHHAIFRDSCFPVTGLNFIWSEKIGMVICDSATCNSSQGERTLCWTCGYLHKGAWIWIPLCCVEICNIKPKVAWGELGLA